MLNPKEDMPRFDGQTVPSQITPAKKRSAYLPTLDGWRAIAILAVIFDHDVIHTLGPLSTRPLYEYGSHGVDVFFAISGILICSRLLDEEYVFGRIHLKDFYIRRAFRILPPALMYLAVICLLAALALITVGWHEVIASIFFIRNYPRLAGFNGGPDHWYTSHFWSLALEEQFYLLLPAVLVLTARRYRASLLAVLALLVAIHRIFALHGRRWILIDFHTDVRIDCLLVPAMFAVLSYDPQNREIFKKWLRLWPLLVTALLCILPFREGTAWRATAVPWLMALIVLGSVLNPQTFLGKALEWKPLRYIGRISYSLYLWQQLFFLGHFGPPDSKLALLQSWPLRLILTFACALASYELLERPLARLGHKLAPSATPGRSDLQSLPVAAPKPA